MVRLTKKAKIAKTKHEFLAELMKWYKYYTRKYPIVKQWTKKDVYDFYYRVKEGTI